MTQKPRESVGVILCVRCQACPKKNPTRREKLFKGLSAQLLSSLILLLFLLREKTERRKTEGDKSQDQRAVSAEAAWEKDEFRQKAAD